MDVDWVPSGDQVEFDSAKKLKELIAKVDLQSVGITKAIAEIDVKINEFNELAEEYLEWLRKWFVLIEKIDCFLYFKFCNKFSN